MKLKSTLVAASLIACSSLSQAATLYDNGPAVGDSTWCHSNTFTCQSSGWTIYDNFSLAQDSVVTGLTYSTIFSTSAAAYVSTNWSIWDADPKFNFSGGSLFSGTDIGTLSAGPASTSTITIEGLNVALASGDYWLGTQVNVNDGSITTYGLSSFASDGNAEQSDSAGTFFNPAIEEAAFSIQGDAAAIPEPETYALMLAGLGLLGFVARRRERGPRIL
jgi:hypothetical protein